MQTHTDELKSRETIPTTRPREQGIEYEDDDEELLNAAEMLSQQQTVISSVIGDILEDVRP